MENIGEILSWIEYRTEDEWYCSKVRSEARRNYNLSYFILIVHIPDEWVLYDPSICSRYFTDCSIISKSGCKFLHTYSLGVSRVSSTTGVSGMIGTINPLSYPNSIPTEPATAWLGIVARVFDLYS